MALDVDTELLEIARQAALRAHAPYSEFRVGAAVRANGAVHVGCNVENASYGLTICAERVAVFAAVAAGAQAIEAVAVSCIDAGGDGVMPCGACRQVLAEFCEGDTPIHVDGAGSFTLSELLPHAFVLTRR